MKIKLRCIYLSLMMLLYSWCYYIHDAIIFMMLLYSWCYYVHDTIIFMMLLYSWCYYIHDAIVFMMLLYSWCYYIHDFMMLLYSWCYYIHEKRCFAGDDFCDEFEVHKKCATDKKKNNLQAKVEKVKDKAFHVCFFINFS